MKKEFYLILPDIRSCHNVGAMFRTADACGVSRLILVGYTAAPPRAQIDKVALGAEKWIPFEKISSQNLKSFVEDLKSKGFSVLALEKTFYSRKLDEVAYRAPLALIVGNEVDGISEEILQVCDIVVHIPMYGKKESLNVSVAAGIAMYEIKKRLS